jgi:hypothetical protein
MKRVCFILFRLLFALGLIMLGIKGLSEVYISKGTIINTVEKFENKMSSFLNVQLNLGLLKTYPVEIIYFQNICLIYGAFLLIFGLSLSKVFITNCFILQFILINNIILDHSEYSLKHFSYLLAILGGPLSL